MNQAPGPPLPRWRRTLCASFLYVCYLRETPSKLCVAQYMYCTFNINIQYYTVLIRVYLQTRNDFETRRASASSATTKRRSAPASALPAAHASIRSPSVCGRLLKGSDADDRVCPAPASSGSDSSSENTGFTAYTPSQKLHRSWITYWTVSYSITKCMCTILVHIRVHTMPINTTA